MTSMRSNEFNDLYRTNYIVSQFRTSALCFHIPNLAHVHGSVGIVLGSGLWKYTVITREVACRSPFVD